MLFSLFAILKCIEMMFFVHEMGFFCHEMNKICNKMCCLMA